MKFFALFRKTGSKSPNEKSIFNQPLSSHSGETTKKIDAIELEMSAEFDASFSSLDHYSTHSEQQNENKKISFSQKIEEAAMLYASGQEKLSEGLLLFLTQQEADSPFQQQLVWWMLFDLLQLKDSYQDFEQLSLDYARRFETSPPQWSPRTAAHAEQTLTDKCDFRGKLSTTNSIAFNQLRNASFKTKKIEFSVGSIAEIDDTGCAALLEIILNWELQEYAITLTNYDHLIKQLHALIKTMPPPICHNAWLLLIEITRLVYDEFEYEEVCMSYTLTFETSPPPSLTAPDNTQSKLNGDFIMPTLVDMPLAPLLQRITKHAHNQTMLILDCSSLIRVSFSAAAPLLEALSALGEHKTVELRNTNFLVSVLLKLIGGGSKLSVFTHRL